MNRGSLMLLVVRLDPDFRAVAVLPPADVLPCSEEIQSMGPVLRLISSTAHPLL
jgi:hypothetical protein